MSALKKLPLKSAGFISTLLLALMLVSNNAFANIAPTTKAVEGESNPFPTETPKAGTAPKTPQTAQTPSANQSGKNASAPVANDNTAVMVAQQGASLVASVNPAISEKRLPLPLFWLSLTAALSLAGLTVAARLVFGTERNAVAVS